MFGDLFSDFFTVPEQEKSNGFSSNKQGGHQKKVQDMSDMLNAYGSGEGSAPYGMLLENYLPKGEAPKSKFSDLMSYISDVAGESAKAQREDPWVSGLTGLSHGLTTTRNKSNEREKAAQKEELDFLNGLLGFAGNERKFKTENEHFDREQSRLESAQEFMNELHSAQAAAARRPNGGSANPYELAKFKADLLGDQRRYDRQEKDIEKTTQNIPKIDEFLGSIDKMEELSTKMPTGVLSRPLMFGSQVAGLFGGGEWAAAAQEFQTLKAPLLKDAKSIFGPSISQNDVKSMEQLLAGKEMEPAAIKAVLSRMKVVAQTNKAHDLAKEQYFNTYGTTDKFESTWTKLLKQNPVADKKTGTINEQNLYKLQNAFNEQNTQLMMQENHHEMPQENVMPLQMPANFSPEDQAEWNRLQALKSEGY